MAITDLQLGQPTSVLLNFTIFKPTATFHLGGGGGVYVVSTERVMFFQFLQCSFYAYGSVILVHCMTLLLYQLALY